MSAISGDNVTTSYSASSAGCIAHGAAMAITERLADLSDLALPSSFYKDTSHPPATAGVLAYLQALLDKDPAAFLARYGGLLQSQELNHFEALRSADYEVDHWLGHFAAQRMAAAQQAADPRRLPARVKNRRLAAMRRLAAEGEYFSEESMRHRAPLLYHQQVGRFAQPQEAPEEDGEGLAEGGGAAAAAAQQMDAGHDGEGRQAEGQGGSKGAGPSGGLGGSCLASALRHALEHGEAAVAAMEDAAAAAGNTAAGPSCMLPEPAAPAGGCERSRDAGAGCSRQAADAAVLDATAAEGRGPGTAAAAGGVADSPAGTRCRMAEIRFSEFLMRQDDEAQLVRRRMQEQQEEDAQLSEHESDDEDEEEGGEDAGDSDTMSEGRQMGRKGRPTQPSALDVAQMRRDFVSEMQSRFLLGQDAEYVDYGTIDADASLDGDWIEQESRDAEEKYFDED